LGTETRWTKPSAATTSSGSFPLVKSEKKLRIACEKLANFQGTGFPLVFQMYGCFTAGRYAPLRARAYDARASSNRSMSA
jgi:hypothetical protein